MYDYWDNPEFDHQTKLLQELFDSIWSDDPIPSGARRTIKSQTSFQTLGDKQREYRIGCIYLAGTRIDNKYCLGSRHVGLLHSALPTDYPKAIRPAFHEGHDELIVCTHGRVIVQHTTSRSDLNVAEDVINPGECLFIRRGSPHKLSLAPLRQSSTGQSTEVDVAAGFLAVKMGTLGDKAGDEDMTRWGRRHPLIEIWKEEMSFLRELAATRDVVARLHIDSDKLNRLLEP